eukprot:3261016-Lingulodinium_polyedra.AAC.1
MGAGLRLRVAGSGATQDAALAAEPASEGGPRMLPARTSVQDLFETWLPRGLPKHWSAAASPGPADRSGSPTHGGAPAEGTAGVAAEVAAAEVGGAEGSQTETVL